MARIGWRFPPLSGGTKQGFNNNDVEAFRGEELMDNLAREICQNSLDAKPEGVSGPVKVVFELRSVLASTYPLFAEYRNCIQGCRKYYESNMGHQLEQFLGDADEMLAREEIPVLVASDYNTKGLEGSRSRDIFKSWEALTSADGISAEKNDDSGGSFGIGKNAPFACSALRMVFYNTLASDGESAFIGVGRLATFHDTDTDEDTQRVGRYQLNDDENRRWDPIYPESNDAFRDLFKRDEQGTDVIIPGFALEDEWEQALEKSVVESFLVAIGEGRLVVEVRGKSGTTLIDVDSLPRLVENYKQDRQMVDTWRLYEAYTHPDKRGTLSILGQDDVEVFIASRPDFGKKIGFFRNTGMRVYYTYRNIFQHYAALVVIREKELASLLRETEPARHNKWDHKNISAGTKEGKEKRERARKAIKSINDQLLELLKAQFEVGSKSSMDAAGVGEYLPDSSEDGDEAIKGSDALRARIKIGKVKKPNAKVGLDPFTEQGKKDEGEVSPGDVHNHTKHPNPSDDTPTPAVTPGGTGGAGANGVAPGAGAKTVTTPNLLKKRVFMISSAQGIYKCIIESKNDCAQVFISFNSRGEDGRSKRLELSMIKCNGSVVPVRDSVAGPIALEAGMPVVCFATFERKEKMMVDVQVTGVAK